MRPKGLRMSAYIVSLHDRPRPRAYPQNRPRQSTFLEPLPGNRFPDVFFSAFRVIQVFLFINRTVADTPRLRRHVLCTARTEGVVIDESCCRPRRMIGPSIQRRVKISNRSDNYYYRSIHCVYVFIGFARFRFVVFTSALGIALNFSKLS